MQEMELLATCFAMDRSDSKDRTMPLYLQDFLMVIHQSGFLSIRKALLALFHQYKLSPIPIAAFLHLITSLNKNVLHGCTQMQ